MEYYEGNVKEKSTELLKNDCRQLLVSVIGDDKANELMALKEMGATNKKINEKVKQLLSQVNHAEKVVLAKEYGSYCKKVFNVEEGQRMRRQKRDEVDANIEKQYKLLYKDKEIYEAVDRKNMSDKRQDDDLNEADLNVKKQMNWLKDGEDGNEVRLDSDKVRLESDNDNNNEDDVVEENIRRQHKWLTNEQKSEIRQLKESGSDGASLTEKMLGYLSLSDLSVRGIAINLLTTGCEKILVKFFGPNNAQEIRNGDRVNEFAENIEDSNQRAQAIVSVFFLKIFSTQISFHLKNNFY